MSMRVKVCLLTLLIAAAPLYVALGGRIEPNRDDLPPPYGSGGGGSTCATQCSDGSWSSIACNPGEYAVCACDGSVVEASPYCVRI